MCYVQVRAEDADILIANASASLLNLLSFQSSIEEGRSSTSSLSLAVEGGMDQLLYSDRFLDCMLLSLDPCDYG